MGDDNQDFVNSQKFLEKYVSILLVLLVIVVVFLATFVFVIISQKKNISNGEINDRPTLPINEDSSINSTEEGQIVELSHINEEFVGGGYA